MGFTSWLRSLTAKTTESSTPPPQSYQRNTDSYSKRNRHTNSQRQTPLPTQASYDAEAEPKKDGRRSRGFSLSRPKSQHGSKNRRSWFGGRPDVDEDIPMVPRLVSMGDQQQHQNAGRREVGVTTLPIPADNNNSRAPMGRTYSRKEEETTDNGRELRRRPSWFSSDRRAPVEALPSLPPAVPVSLTASIQPATSALPADKRRSRAASMKSMNSTRSKKKRSSFWASSNPADDSESDVPPVPALVRGTSTESSCNDSSDASDNRRRTVRKSTPGEARPLSTASRKYVPKSAAKGFLHSTNGASEEARKSFRQSFSLEDQADMICLTDEQRVEWARLMNEENKLENPFESKDEEGTKKDKFSNDQALAALEFGIR